MKIIIPGRPITKKNSSRLGFAGKRRIILPSEAFERYEKEALWHLKKYKAHYGTMVHVKCLYWLPNRQWWPDLIGLLQATSDILESAGIIENDKLIDNYDGSRIVGIDRQNPRAEISIEAVG